MKKFQAFIKWIAKQFFLISIILFTLIYVWWFRLTPWNPKNGCCSDYNYIGGLKLLAVYGILILLWLLVKRSYLASKLFFVFVLIFLLLNSLWIGIYLPRIIKTAHYNGAQYYLVVYSTWPERPFSIYQLTKWKGFHGYDSHDVGINGGFEIRYDEKMQLVNVVKIFPKGYEELVFSDSVPPRQYSYGTEVEFEGKRYYLFDECHQNPSHPYLCDAYTSGLAQCELDNTACEALPFQYTGDYVFEFNMQRDSALEEMQVYFAVGAYPGIATLIFSDGDMPRCHLEGCEILEPSK